MNMANFASAEPSLERGTYLVEGPAACGNCHTPQGPDDQEVLERDNDLESGFVKAISHDDFIQRARFGHR